MKTPPSQWLLAGLAGAALLAVLWLAAFSVAEWTALAAAERAEQPTAAPIGMASLGVRVDQPAAQPDENATASGYLLAFEIISVHLVVVLVGAAYLARAKRRVRREPTPIIDTESRPPVAAS